MKYFLVFGFILLSFASLSQDLNARVELLYPNLQSVNKNTLKILEKTITEFLNNRKWSDDVIQPQERINCSFVITISAWDGATNFTATAQIQSSRPVYGSSYNTTILNTSDPDFSFNYLEGQALEFSEQSYSSNLSSLLAFYAYVIVGMDYDSFSKLGGSLLYYRAQNVVNSAQVTSDKGWKAVEGFRNKYWLSQNFVDRDYNLLRESIYTYHRLGLDVLSTKPKEGIKAILSILPQIQKIDRLKQGNVLSQLFISAKVDEIVGVLSGADVQERVDAYTMLTKMDPSNSFRYEALRK